MEIWKDIPGYEGFYQASNMGNVKTLNYNKTGKVKKLKLVNTKQGYIIVNLFNKDIKGIRQYVHRIIAKTFIENLEGKKFVNHKNGIKTDNRIENLEWCTASENLKHSVNTLGNKTYFQKYPPSEGKLGQNHHCSKKVNQYDLDGNFIKTWECMKTASKILSVNYVNISLCCYGHRKTCGGYKWEFNIK